MQTGVKSLRVREQHRPRVADPVVEADLALRRLGLEVGCRVAELQSHLLLVFLWGRWRARACRGTRRMSDARGSPVNTGTMDQPSAIEVSGLVKTFGAHARPRRARAERRRAARSTASSARTAPGKSTTIRVLLGLLRADAGDVAAARRRPVARRRRAAPPARLRARRREPVAERSPAARRSTCSAGCAAASTRRGARSCSSASSSTRRRRAAPTRRATARRWRSSPRSPRTPSCSSSTSRRRGSTR